MVRTEIVRSPRNLRAGLCPKWPLVESSTPAGGVGAQTRGIGSGQFPQAGMRLPPAARFTINELEFEV